MTFRKARVTTTRISTPRRWAYAPILVTSLLCPMRDVRAQALTLDASRTDRRNDMIQELATREAHPSMGVEARTFDRFVGTWDCAFSFRAEDGTVRHSTGELRFGWIIDGRAIQDIWIGYPKRPGDARTIGTSIRFFEPKSNVWRVVFVAPAFGLITQVQGGVEGDRIVLRGEDAAGSLLRWSFNDINADSFNWRGESSRDGGKTWKLEEDHRMTRRVRR